MKKHMLRISLAVAVVLGAGSIATGSVILASFGTPDQAPATEAGNVDATHPVSSETPDRATGAGNEKVAMVGSTDTVLVMAGSGLDPVSAPLAESDGTGPVAVASAGSAGVGGASGISAASAGAGSVPSAPGRNVQQAALAMPSATTMPRPSPDSSAPAGGSSAGPTETGTSGPAASLPEVSATPETGTGTTPTEIAKVVLPELTDGTPDTVPHNYGPNDLPIPPWLDSKEPVITTGAKDPAASPGNTVPEPSTLALLGIAALGLVARRRA